MPKRMIDGDAMWSSDRLARCELFARREFAWLFPISDPNGSFELKPRAIWGKVAAIRDDLTIEVLGKIFAEYERVKLLFVWEESGKRYAHWVGSDKPGRLPPPSHRKYERTDSPPVPQDKLAAWLLETTSNQSITEPQASTLGTPSLSLGVTQASSLDGRVGLGRVGFGRDDGTRAREIPNTPIPESWETCLVFASDKYREREREDPNWNHLQIGKLQTLLENKPDTWLLEFERRWTAYMETTDQFHRKQGGALGYFCDHVDKFKTESTGGVNAGNEDGSGYGAALGKKVRVVCMPSRIVA